MRIRITMACAALTALGVSAEAVAQGYFDFGQIPGAPQEPTVQVDLGPAVINFAAAAARETDPGAADLISGLRGIHVRAYEQLDDAAAVQSFVEEASLALERDGWERAVYVQDGTDKVRVYTQVQGEVMQGMTVLVVDSSEAVFVNIAGQIDPAQLGRVAAAMGMGDVLEVLSDAAEANAGGRVPAAAEADEGANEEPNEEPDEEPNEEGR